MGRCCNLLTCPVCGAGLLEVERSLRCNQGHTFDRAREGYVNLLVAGHGRSKIRGDTSEMLRARRRTLDRGYFEPLSVTLNEFCAERFGAARAARTTIVDAGCGEGYYIGRVSGLLGSTSANDFCFFGIDVSRDAARMAARRYGSVTFIVADVKHHIQLEDGSVDLLLDIFAPRNPSEFARVLHPDGVLLIALPRENHLIELCTQLPLLRIDADKRERVVAQMRHRFELVAQDTLEYQIQVDDADVLDFLLMTPNYWHLDEATIVKASTLRAVQMTMSLSLLYFQLAPERA